MECRPLENSQGARDTLTSGLSQDRPPLPSQELDDWAPSLSEGLDLPLFWVPTCVPGFENAQ